MDLQIRPIRQEDYESVHAFQCEYLDIESIDEFVQRVEAHPELYLAAINEGQLAGICYGHPSRKDQTAVNLQGIAVNLDTSKNFARRGIGSRLIAMFEKAVKQRGYPKIGVGSADDLKVEHFYIKNGFHAVELVALDTNYEELERISVKDYVSGSNLREQLRSKYNPQEVIFIFEKDVGETP